VRSSAQPVISDFPSTDFQLISNDFQLISARAYGISTRVAPLGSKLMLVTAVQAEVYEAD
jgi:hypothetical protein